MVDTAQVKLFGKTIGAVRWDDRRRVAQFEYDSRFADTGLEPAPSNVISGKQRKSSKKYATVPPYGLLSPGSAKSRPALSTVLRKTSSRLIENEFQI